MRTVDLSKPPERLTCLMYGGSRSGKTYFAATWPRPVFLSDAVEGGWETIRNMDPNAFYEPGHLPEVWAVESQKDIMEGIKKIAATVKDQPGKILTVVVDSLTFLGDLLQDTFLVQFAGEIEKNKFALWDKLRVALRHYMIEAHKIPVNWVWLCLAQEPESGNSGGPMIAGQMRGKMPAACNLLLYQNVYQMNPQQPPVRETRTKKYGPFPAGGRSELPDPLPEGGYLALEEAMGLANPLPAVKKSGTAQKMVASASR